MARKPEPVLIGIDGGGSRTRGVIMRGDEELDRRETGTARVGTVGVVESSERLLNLISELCQSARVQPMNLDAVAIGLAGVWLPGERQRAQQLLRLFARERKIEIKHLKITSDAGIALEGAFDGDPGMVLIVGTGTIAVGVTPEGEVVRCGGWGIELSDEGSGAWLGREGLTALTRAFDGRGAGSALVDAMVGLFPVIDPNNPRTLVAAFHEKMFDYSTVAPLLMQCAENGDAVCRAIVDRAAFHLMESVKVLAGTHFSQAGETPVVCMGGIMEADTLLARLVAEQIDAMPTLTLRDPKGSAIDGALGMARKMIREGMA